jgi:prepilin-type N-terminal cleavage/methylation domain-containing protein
MRKGFTLIEMMVATALTMFIMAILSQAFVTSLDVFSGLKGLGDMEANLRTGAVIIRADLAADHFEGKRRLSDPDFWTRETNLVYFPDAPAIPAASAAAPVRSPVREGFFHIRQGSASTLEGTGLPDGMPSYLAVNHVLHFTVKLRGNSRDKVFMVYTPQYTNAAGNAANSPLTSGQTEFFNQNVEAIFRDNGTTFSSHWAEVAYYLVKTGTTDFPGNPNGPSGMGLYALYRFQGAVTPKNTYINGYPDNPNNATPAGTPLPQAPQPNFMPYASWIPHPDPNKGGMFFSCPSSLAHPSARALDTSGVGTTSYPVRRAVAGQPPPDSALLLTNVVSFNVQVLLNGATDFSDLPASQFDTANTAFAAMRIMAIKVGMRVWDLKSQQTRQLTVIQDM